MYEYRCDERLRPKTEGSTRLTYTGLLGGLEHLNIETKLNERFESVEIQSLEVYYETIKREPKIRGINKCKSRDTLFFAFFFFLFLSFFLLVSRSLVIYL